MGDDLVAAQIQLPHDQLLTDIELGKKALIVTAKDAVLYALSAAAVAVLIVYAAIRWWM